MKNRFETPYKVAIPGIEIQDETGNEYVCPSDSISNPERPTARELTGCFVRRSSGVKIEST